MQACCCASKEAHASARAPSRLGFGQPTSRNVNVYIPACIQARIKSVHEMSVALVLPRWRHFAIEAYFAGIIKLARRSVAVAGCAHDANHLVGVEAKKRRSR